MIELLKKIILRNATGKKVLIFFVLANMIYLTMLFITIPKVMEFSNGMKLLDMIPEGYDREYVDSLLTTLGEKGRNTYLYNQIPLDMIFPLLFAVGYSLLYAWFFKQLKQTDSPYFYFSFLPFVSGISDYAENLGIITMLKQYPDYSPETVSITNTFSMLKSSTSAIFLIALVFLMVYFGVNYLKSKPIVSGLLKNQNSPD